MRQPKPLWAPDNEKARLAELTARSDQAAKDRPLRRDVRSLGAILGQVLVEQSGQELFDGVEELRRLLIQHRDQVRRRPDSDPSGELMAKAQAMVSLPAEWRPRLARAGRPALAKRGPAQREWRTVRRCD